MVLDISGCKGPALRSFIPGDALAVLPTNPADEVGACLALLGLHGADADAQIPPPTSDVPAHLRRPLSARLALAERVDIGTAAGWPRPPLLKLLAGHATDSAERGRLHALLAEPSKARARRLAAKPSLAQLLADHPSARPPLAALLDALPPLAERYYSIASSPLSAPDSARIVFTALSYSVRLPDGTCEQRRGLCSSQLADKGEALNASGGWVKPTVRVYRRRPTGNELRLPRELGTPVIMVGPGTGVAPFIAFLQHRRALALQGKAAVSAATGGKFAGASGPVGQAHLFFGCQHRVGDFLFDDELDAFERDGTLTRLHTVRAAERWWRRPARAAGLRGAAPAVLTVPSPSRLPPPTGDPRTAGLLARRDRQRVCGRVAQRAAQCQLRAGETQAQRSHMRARRKRPLPDLGARAHGGQLLTRAQRDVPRLTSHPALSPPPLRLRLLLCRTSSSTPPRSSRSCF